MGKRLKIIVSILAVITLATVGGTLTALAYEETPPAQTQQEQLNEALKLALENAVAQGLITQEQADGIIVRWQNAGKAQHQFAFQRMLGMDEAELDAWLAEQVAAGKLTEEQALQIKQRCQQVKQQTRQGQMMKRLCQMDETEVDAWLAEQVAAGKITEEQALQIKEKWEVCQENMQQQCNANKQQQGIGVVMRQLKGNIWQNGKGQAATAKARFGK